MIRRRRCHIRRRAGGGKVRSKGSAPAGCARAVRRRKRCCSGAGKWALRCLGVRRWQDMMRQALLSMTETGPSASEPGYGSYILLASSSRPAKICWYRKALPFWPCMWLGHVMRAPRRRFIHCRRLHKPTHAHLGSGGQWKSCPAFHCFLVGSQLPSDPPFAQALPVDGPYYPYGFMLSLPRYSFFTPGIQYRFPYLLLTCLVSLENLRFMDKAPYSSFYYPFSQYMPSTYSSYIGFGPSANPHPSSA